MGRTVSSISVAAVLAIAGCSSGSEDVSDGTSASSSSTSDPAAATTVDEGVATTETTTAPETTTTEVVSPTTTTTTASSSTTVAGSPDTALPVIDIDDAMLAGATNSDGLSGDEVLGEFQQTFGAPDVDSDWIPMPPKLLCAGSLDYRNVQWDDLRIVLERPEPGADSFFTGWSLGLANIPVVPGELSDWSEETGITTNDGIGIGDPASELVATAGDNVRRTDPSTLLAIGARVITIETDENDDIVGFGSGRNDCIGGDIVNLPCNRPVPVYSLPDGAPSGDVSVDEASAVWGLEQMDDPSDTDNLVTETFGGDDDFSQIATEAPIRGVAGPTSVVAVPIGDPGVGGWAFVVLDDRIDCDRRLRTETPFEEDEAAVYAQTLATGFNPQL